jgi:hypothetical protein
MEGVRSAQYILPKSRGAMRDGNQSVKIGNRGIFSPMAGPALQHLIKRGWRRCPAACGADRPADRSRMFGRFRTGISRAAPQNPSTILIRNLHHGHSPKAPISATKRALAQAAVRKMSRKHGQISAFGRRVLGPRLASFTSACRGCSG